MDYAEIIETICDEFNIELVEIANHEGELYMESGALYISEDWIEDADDGDNFFEILRLICGHVLNTYDSSGAAGIVVALSLCRRFEVTISEEKQEEIEDEYPDSNIQFEGVVYHEPEYKQLKDIIAVYGIPVDIVRPHYYGDFFFRVEGIDYKKQRAKGMYYKDGEEYKKHSMDLVVSCKLYNEDDSEYEEESEDDVVEEEIDYRDFFIHSDEIHCGHECTKVLATVQCCSAGEIYDVSFDAFYCEECGVYYFTETQYRRFVNNSEHLLCQVMSYREYRAYKADLMYGKLNAKSALGALGYTVSQKDDLSEDERRTILQYAIDGDILSKERVIQYIKFFIRLNERNYGQKNAIRRWQSDLDWLSGVQKSDVRHVGVKRIVFD